MTNEDRIKQLEAQIKGQRDAIASLMTAIQRLACYIEYRDEGYDLTAAANDDWRDQYADKIKMEGVWHEAFKAYYQAQISAVIPQDVKKLARHPAD